MARAERSLFRERLMGIDDPLARQIVDQATADMNLLAEMIQAGRCASYVHQQREAAVAPYAHTRRTA